MIMHITKAYIRTYTDSGQRTAYVEWINHQAKYGRTEGPPTNLHMKALLDRARREGLRVRQERW